VASDEDDWGVNVRLGQFGLKVEAAQSWQPYVKHQATGGIRELALQHFGRRTECLNPQSHRLKKIDERSPHRCVVFNNEDDRDVRVRGR
jgi:hypothetical protein